LINIISPQTTFIESSVKIGKNVTICPFNILKGNTVIGDNVYLGPSNFICDSIIKPNTKIEYSYIQNSIIGKSCLIGPYSHIRPNSVIKNNVKIGNFVEVKNSIIGDNTKASHLSYIGDAIIGKNCNIGCGAIFVNYNGTKKQNTYVQDNCFIGSNVNVIAPVKISKGTYICAGSTLTQSTKQNDFVVARSRETIKHNYANKYFVKEKKE